MRYLSDLRLTLLFLIDPVSFQSPPIERILSATEWYAQTVDIDRAERRKYRVAKLVWYKQKSMGQRSQHEFIVAYGAPPTDHSALCLLIERGPSQGTSARSTSLTSLEKPPVAAPDHVILTIALDLPQLLKKRKAQAVATYTPTQTTLPIFELARLLHLLSEEGPAYELHHTHHDSCHWLAKTIVGVAVEEFRFLEDRSTPYFKRWLWGWLAGERNRKDPESDVRDVIARLRKEMRDDPEPIGEREAAILEDLRKMAEEHAETMRKRDKEIAKILDKERDELERKKNEEHAEWLRKMDKEHAERLRKMVKRHAEVRRMMAKEHPEMLRMMDKEVAEILGMKDEELAEELAALTAQLDAASCPSSVGQ